MPLVPLASSRGSRKVQPDVAACDELASDGEVVVLEERQPRARRIDVPTQREQSLQELLGLGIARVRLAGDQELHRRLSAEDAGGTRRIGCEEREPLVAGETPREPERQRVRIQTERARLRILELLAAQKSVPLRLLTRVRDQAAARFVPRVPELLVRDPVHG